MKQASPNPSTTDILATLVGFDTTSARPTDTIITWIEQYLDGHGIRHTRSQGPETGKFNLHAIIGPDRAGGLAFAGHVDCVPITGQNWTSDPFSLREDEGRLYARGSTDMKGFVAAMLAAAPDIAARDPQQPIHLLFTFDEEITCDGARYAMQSAIERDRLPAFCIVGEPTGMAPVIAHKGRLAARITFTGKAAHSSAPELGVNAIHAMGHAIAHASARAEELAATGRRVDGFDPPYTTSQIGLASGGRILNIVPDSATLDIEWRPVPGDDARAELAALQAVLEPVNARMKAADITCGIIYDIICDLPPLALNTNHPLADLVRQTTGHNTTSHVSYGTEAGIYQRAGMESIVCGPGDIAQAHKPDEWIALTELDRCDRFLRAIVDRVCHNPALFTA